MPESKDWILADNGAGGWYAIRRDEDNRFTEEVYDPLGLIRDRMRLHTKNLVSEATARRLVDKFNKDKVKGNRVF